MLLSRQFAECRAGVIPTDNGSMLVPVPQYDPFCRFTIQFEFMYGWTVSVPVQHGAHARVA